MKHIELEAWKRMQGSQAPQATGNKFRPFFAHASQKTLAPKPAQPKTLASSKYWLF